uniref:NECAP-like protein CG9132 (inferred by orthology to a D. melanogaster protein) n=1 Tax=Strongyloides venezuelensis TaxID=75913 RepID=A0A0K0G529_STRVS
MDDYESVILVKPEVFIYRIPPLTTAHGHKAADWKLDAPDWVGRMRLIVKGKKLELCLDDKTTGELYAKAPIDSLESRAVEAVVDSSRYFIVQLRSDTGRTAFVGMGFADRSDSFDFNVALQDHFRSLQKEVEIDSTPKLDLGFKEGQTITVKIGNKTSTPRPKTSSSSGGAVPLLPPPPSSSNRIRNT